MNDRVLDIYKKLANRLILQTAHGLTGQAKSVLSDFETFRRSMEPAWNKMPGPAQLMGRDQLRWDDVLRSIARELFIVAAGGSVAMQPDAADRLADLVERVLRSPKGAMLATRVPTIDVELVPLADPTAAAATGAPVVLPYASPPAAVAPPMAAPVALAAGAPLAAVPVAMAAPVEPAKPTTPEITIGIDLGTTYSAVAYVDATGHPTTINNAAGDLVTPSVVLFDDEGPVVGKEAVAASTLEPERVAVCVKRDMGSKEHRKPINGVRLPPEVISSVILKTLLSDARRRLGPNVNKAVITVPAYFDELRRRATTDAGRIAGLEVLDIINEPTAAALAFGYQNGFLNPDGQAAGAKPMTVCVYDLGGGTFDVTIVEIRGNSFKALATDGDVSLGGKDFDDAIVAFAAEKFQEKFGVDPRKNPSCHMDMWTAAEAAKKTLTERTKASLVVSSNDKRLKVEITRAEFEDLTAPLVSRTKTTMDIVVRQAGLTWAQIDRILLVGGSTRMPQIAPMVKQLTGKEPDRSVSPDEAVAHGAALYAKMLLTKSSASPTTPAAFSITNINSHSLGIVGIDPATGKRRNAILIPKNTPLPVTVTKVFKTNKPNQPTVVIRVVEGESERPEACIQVGVCRIEDLPPNLPQGTPVQVSYAYHEDGQLEVTGQVTGAEAVRTVFLRENTLDNDQVAMWYDYVQAIEN